MSYENKKIRYFFYNWWHRIWINRDYLARSYTLDHAYCRWGLLRFVFKNSRKAQKEATVIQGSALLPVCNYDRIHFWRNIQRDSKNESLGL